MDLFGGIMLVLWRTAMLGLASAAVALLYRLTVITGVSV